MEKTFEKNKYLVVKPEDIDPLTGRFDLNPKAKYFVLRIDSDIKAREALKTYIVELTKARELTLANQLSDWLESIPKPKSEPHFAVEGRCPVCGSMDSVRQTKTGLIEGKERIIDQHVICNNCGVIRKF